MAVEGARQSLNIDAVGHRQTSADDGPPDWRVSAHIVLHSVIGYCCVYFLRYPITYIGDEIRDQVFGTIFGVEFLVKDSMSIAFLLGFGVAKIPAVTIMTSPLFFNNRLIMLTVLNFLTGFLVTVPLALSKGDPMWTTLGLFLGLLPSSWVYGGMFTYFEGRTTTEQILACNTAALILAGSWSRGAAQWVLGMGVPPHWMPFVLFVVVLVPMTIAYYYLDKSPKPNAYEMRHRKERTHMSNEKKMEFARSYALPLTLLITAYAVMTAMRQFRDLDTRSLYRAANGGEDPPTLFVTFVDFAPAVTSFLSFMAINSISDSYRCLTVQFSMMMVCLIFLLITTALFNAGVIGGLVWHVSVAVGVLNSLLLGVPVWDRIVSSSLLGHGATSTFIMYTADMMGYVFSIIVVVWKRFAAPEETMEVLLQNFVFVLTGGAVVCILLLAISTLYFWRRQKQEEGEALALQAQTAS